MRTPAASTVMARLFTWLQGRHLLQLVIRNTVWQVTDKVIRMGVGLLVGVWVARYLGPAGFGLLNFGIAFVAIFTPIADCGLQQMVIRELIRRPADESKIVASALALRVIGAAFAVGMSMLCAMLLRPGAAEVHLVVLVVGLSLFPISWDVIDFYFQARMRPRPIVIIRVLSLLVFAAAKIALIVNEAPLLSFAWVIVGEAALSALLMWLLVSAPPRSLVLRGVCWAEMRTLLALSWPLAVSGLSVMLYMRIDQIMLGRMLGDRAVGMFSAAVRVSEAWYFFPIAMLAATAPALTSLHSVSSELYRSRLLLSIRVVLGISVAVAVLLTMFGNHVVNFLYGPSYQDAAQVLVIHVWAGVFVALGVAASPFFVNAGLQSIKMIHTVLAGFLNVALNAWLIPRFGVIGAAWSTLVSYSFAAFWLNAVWSKTRPLFALQLASFKLYSRA